MAESPGKLRALVQALNLIPYARRHPDKTFFEIAADLGMSPAELKEVTSRLFCTGVGKYPEDLIDLDVDYRSGISIINDQGLDRPLQLTPIEASALLLVLDSLETMPGLVDSAAVRSAAEKIRAIMDRKTAAIYDSLAAVGEQESEAQQVIAQAIELGRQVSFGYISAGSGRYQERTISPVQFFLHDSELYVIGWEDNYQQHRRFRVDRISQPQLLELSATPHREQLDFNAADPFGFSQAPYAEVEVNPQALWLAGYYAMEIIDHPGSDESAWVRARMPIGSEQWFYRFMVGHADLIRVTAPPSLIAAVARRKAAAREAYEAL